MPLYNHRESWALENRSPKVLIEESEEMPKAAPSGGGSLEAKSSRKPLSDREKFISGIGDDNELIDDEEREHIMTDGNIEKEILIVASKLKNYIRNKSGMNTSAAVVDVLSDKIRDLCDHAIETAKQDGRKTVMDRDFG